MDSVSYDHQVALEVGQGESLFQNSSRQSPGCLTSIVDLSVFAWIYSEHQSNGNTNHRKIIKGT